MRESISFRNGVFPPDAIRISQFLAVGFTVTVRVLPAKLNSPGLKGGQYKDIFYINAYIIDVRYLNMHTWIKFLKSKRNSLIMKNEVTCRYKCPDSDCI